MENERKIKEEEIREALEACLPDMGDYGKMKDKLRVRLLKLEACREIQGAVYESLGDVAILLCFCLLDDKGKTVTCVVCADIFQMWGVPKEQVFREALGAASRFAPPRLYPLEESPYAKDKKGHAFLSGEYEPDRDIGGNCLSTEQFVNGAAAIFYPGVAEKLAELLGGGIFLLFLSPCQVRVYYDQEEPEDRKLLADSLHTAICDLAEKVEIMSTKVYHYSLEGGFQVERE